MDERVRKVLLIGDGKSPIIDKNFIDYLMGNNSYVFDILSFKKMRSNKYTNIWGLPQVNKNRFYRISSLRFLILFVVRGLRVIRKYDIVHFHMFYPGIVFLAPFFKGNVIVTLWGSDFLKADIIKKLLLSYTLRKAKIVTCTNVSFSRLILRRYPFVESKMYVLPYMLKYIEMVNSDYENRKASTLVRIVIGSNSNTAQNHSLIIDAINKSKIVRNKFHLIVPFTYGRGSEEYKLKIGAHLDATEFSYDILTDGLNDKELTDLRLNSDVFINLQDSDQLSGAMLEHLCADNIVITGNWINYDVLKHAGVAYHSIDSISDLSSLFDSLDFYDKPNNREVIARDYLPENVLNKWNQIYESV